MEDKQPKNNTPHLLDQYDYDVQYEGDYFNMRTMRKCIATTKMIERLAADMVKWASGSEDVLLISEFYLEKGISRMTWYKWKNKFPLLKECCDYVEDILNTRREKQAYHRKLEVSMVRYTLPVHSDIFKQFEEWRSHLKSKEDSNAAKLIVVETSSFDKKSDQ